jgi:regulator of replication initiation timing
MNATIQDGIQSMQGKTRQLVTAHEDELRRSFRAQMHEVERQLAEERQRHMDGAAQYLEQIAQLKSELSWMKDEATRLDTANQKFRQEAQSLRIQYKAQEDDRTMLVRQIAVLKMENARLRDELGKKILAGDANGNAEEGNAASHPHHSTSMSMSMAMTSPTATTMSAAAHPPNMEDQSDIIADMQRRFDETVKRMKKVLETERGHLKQVRAAHVALLADRTELEGFLRACIEDVRQELTLAVGPTGTSNGNLSSPSNGGGIGGNAPAAVWKPADRQRIIEMLLSKERVLALLYEKTFPQKKHLVNRLPAMIGSPNEKGAGSPTRHQPQMSHEEQVLGRLRAFVEVDEEV